MSQPVIMIGLDGWDQDIADRLISQGRLPTFAQLQKTSARAWLEHGDARWTGLAWEHVATGHSPDDAGRWAAVDFHPRRYEAAIKPTRQRPFLADLATSAVVFDAPYFDLPSATTIQGIVNWGAHDPGVARFARPADVVQDIEARFGPYPATRYIYGQVWHDPSEAQKMSDALIRAVEVRSEATEWLIGERLTDWDVAFVVVSEFHSALEALYHGWDKEHPLHSMASAVPAKVGIVGVYEAADRMIARLLTRFADARFVLFNLHGMGPNDSDIGSMALLPELLYRMRFGKPLAASWPLDADHNPAPMNGSGWSGGMRKLFPQRSVIPRAINRLLNGKASDRPLN